MWNHGNVGYNDIITISGSGPMYDYDGYDSPFAGVPDPVAVVIGEGITHIGAYAFFDFEGLEEIVIPESVTSVGARAFQKCFELRRVTVNNPDTTFGVDAFRGCPAGLTFTGWYGSTAEAFASANAYGFDLLPGNGSCGANVRYRLRNGTLTLLGSGAMNDYSVTGNPSPFCNDTSIQHLVIEDGVTSVGQQAFYGCAGLTSAAIADSVTSIDTNAFFGCKLLASVSLGSGLGSVSGTSFVNCTSLQQFTLSPDNTALRVENGVLFDKQMKQLIIYPAGRRDAAYAVPESVTSVGSYAFAYNTQLRELTFGSMVSAIGSSAFRGCTNLAGAVLPDSLGSVGTAAFYGCTGLKHAEFGTGLTQLGSSIFQNCTALTEVVFKGSAPASIGNYIFWNCTLTAYVPAGDATWTDAKKQNYGGTVTWVSWAPEPTFILPAALTTIESEAFSGIRAEAVLIPNTVTGISGNPFAGSGVRYIYGFAGSAAEALANAYGYTFMAIDDAWLASH